MTSQNHMIKGSIYEWKLFMVSPHTTLPSLVVIGIVVEIKCF